jgi:hypothetical protein
MWEMGQRHRESAMRRATVARIRGEGRPPEADECRKPEASGKRERPNPPTVMWDTPNRFALRYVALDECFYGGPPVFQSSVTLRNAHGLNLGTLSDDQPT